MDGIANVAKQQQTQMNSEYQGMETSRATVKTQQVNEVKKMQEEASASSTKINSKEDVEKLVDDLNDAMSPMNTSLKFGVDTDDIFYVSVIESETSKMIRRFPAEQAADFLPKMQEVSGMLFDSRG
jgi:flagellar protein FlaG